MKRAEHSPPQPPSKEDDDRPGIAQAPSPSLKKTRNNPDASQQPRSGDLAAAKAETEKGPAVSCFSVAMASTARPLSAAIAASSKKPYDPAAAKGGPRIRLPDKLIEYLNNEVETEVLWWQPDGDGFAFDSTTVQTGFLDKHFEGTKLISLIRSLNRWGFRRIFYHTLPKTVFSFHHPLFKKDAPELTRQMKMLSYSGQQAAEMEEFNRRQRETGLASLPGSPQPAPEASAMVAEPFVPTSPPTVPQPQTSMSELLQTVSSTVPQAALQQGVIQSMLSNPLYSNQVLQSLQEQQRQQQQELQLRLVVQQQQQQQQSQPQQQQQANLTQALFLQSVLNIVQQRPGQQQQQPAQQQQSTFPTQLSSIPSLATAVNAQLLFPFQSQPVLSLQQAQNTALLQYLNSQQRIDDAGTGTILMPQSSNVIGDQYASFSLVGNADGKEEESELRRPDENDNVNNKNESNQQYDTR